MNTRFFSSHAKRLDALKRTRVDFAVRFLLGQHLEPMGINPHFNYLSTLADHLKPEVGTSVSLFDEALACIEQGILPNYTQGLSDVFSRHYSFATQDRVEKLDVIAFESILIDIAASLSREPSMDLSYRAFKPLTVEDVHRALKEHLPDIDPDKVFMTSLIDHLGERVVSSSEPLSEYLLSHFKHDEIPYLPRDGHLGVFTVAYSGAEEHRHAHLGTADINDLLIRLVDDLLI